MKLIAVAKILLAFRVLRGTAEVHGDEECTFGRLFISDVNTTSIRVYNLDEESLSGLVSEASITAPGGPGQALDSSHDSLHVISSFWGTSSLFLADGVVSMINAGIRREEHGDHFHLEIVDPYLYENGKHNCGPVYHASSHAGLTVMFCDGSFTATPQRNTTVTVFDESLLGTAADAKVAHYTLPGAHHGMAVAVESGHILHSLATQERIDRVPGASSLPNTFQVVDYQGKVLHSFNDVTDTHKHCKLMHGSSATSGVFVLGCGIHGLLAIKFNEITKTYSSNAIRYPTLHAMAGYRTGTLHYNEKSDILVGNFNTNNVTLDVYLIAVHESATRITESNMLNLGANGTYSTSCPRGFEMAEAKMFVMIMPTGLVQVYSVDKGWNLLAEKQVVPNMVSCTGVTLVTGFFKAFVAHELTKKLYVLSLHEVTEGIIGVEETDLGFHPRSMVVAGVPDGAHCDPRSKPTLSPTEAPTEAPTKPPSKKPTKRPSKKPVKKPTKKPTKIRIRH